MKLAINYGLVRDQALVNVTSVIALYRVREFPHPKSSMLLAKYL